jgi:hypothetical protein
MVNLGVTAIEVRVKMAAMGWQSKDSIGAHGWSNNKYGYSIWFERWDWHGARRDKITFVRTTPDLDKIDEETLRCAEVALLAWETFSDPDAKPYVDVHGELRNGRTPA